MDKFDELAREDLKRVGWPINVDLWDVLEEWKRETLLELAAIRRDTWNEAIEAAENAHMDVTERLGGGWAAHMAANKAIRALKVEKP